MTARKKFFYNATLLTVVALSVKTVNLAFSAFISRKIGAEALGLYTLIGTVYAFAVTFATSGINLTVTRLVASAVGEGKRGEISRIMRHAVGYALIFSSFASLVLFFFAPYFSSAVLKDARSEAALRALAVSLVPIAMSAVFSGYFIGVKKIVRSSVYQVSSQIFKIVITVVLVNRAANGGVAMATLALCISTTLGELFSFVLAFFQYLTAKKAKPPEKCETEFSAITKMALPLAFSAYIRSALLTLEHVLIPRRLLLYDDTEGAALASYGTLHGMALPVALYPMSPLSSFASLLVPEFAESEARGDLSRLKRICEEVIAATLKYAAPVAVFIYLFSEELAYCLYSSYSAGHHSAMLAPVIPIMYLDHVTDAMLKGIGEQVYSMWVNISDSFLSVFLIWFLLPKMGISGYALVIVIMEGYNFLLSFIRLKKRVKFSLKSLFSFFLPFIEAAVSAFLADALFQFSGSLTTAPLLIAKMVFSLCIFFFLNLSLSLIIKKCIHPCKEKLSSLV